MERALPTLKTYKPFLSSTTLRILGYLIFGISQIYIAVIIFVLIAAVDLAGIVESGNIESIVSTFTTELQLIQNAKQIKTVMAIGKVAQVFLLTGLFARLESKEADMKKTVIWFGFISFIAYLLELVIFRTLVSFFINFIVESADFSPLVVYYINTAIDTASQSIISVYLSINIYIDMFLAALFYFFIHYEPKKGYYKRHIVQFRLYAILPVLYVITSMVLHGITKNGYIENNLPIAIGAALSFKAYGALILFVVMTLFVKYREPIYNFFHKKKNTDYKAYENSNRAVFDFSVVIAVTITLISLIDYIIMLYIPTSKGYGFGSCIYMFVAAIPFLLFNYRIRGRFKVLNIGFALYYMLLFLMLFALYGSVIILLIIDLRTISDVINALLALVM